MKKNEHEKKKASKISSIGPKRHKKSEPQRRRSTAQASRHRSSLPKSSRVNHKNGNVITISCNYNYNYELKGKVPVAHKNLDIPEPENDEIPNRSKLKRSK